jgi:hypothetical protein
VRLTINGITSRYLLPQLFVASPQCFMVLLQLDHSRPVLLLLQHGLFLVREACLLDNFNGPMLRTSFALQNKN